MAEVPSDLRVSLVADEQDVKKYLTKGGQVTLAGLATLRTDLKISKNKYSMAQAKVLSTQMLAYHLEDIIAAKNDSSKDVIHWSIENKDSTTFGYKWHIVIKPYLLKFLAFVAAVWSLFSFLGVICSMHGVDRKASVYFLAVHDNKSTMAGITIFVLITLGYATYVTMWSMFQMRFGGLSELVPFATSPEGLSFNVRMCARLAAPLAFFYLGWISENGLSNGAWVSNAAPSITSMQNVTYTNVTYIHLPNSTNATAVYSNYTVLENVTISRAIPMPSSFSRFYQLQKVKIIEQTFGTLFPSVLLVLVPIFASNIFNIIMVKLKMDKYQIGTRTIFALSFVDSCCIAFACSDTH